VGSSLQHDKKDQQQKKTYINKFYTTMGYACDLSSTSCFKLLHPDPLKLRPKTHKSADKMKHYG